MNVDASSGDPIGGENATGVFLCTLLRSFLQVMTNPLNLKWARVPGEWVLGKMVHFFDLEPIVAFHRIVRVGPGGLSRE